MVNLLGSLSHFNPVKVLLIGDFMLDTYTTGKIRRISPEAPVSVLHVQKEESRPGGAGNVVLNLISLGATVSVLGRIGYDSAGEQLKESLMAEGAETEGLFLQKGFKTPVKNRLIADSQQLLRVDFEAFTPLPSTLEEVIIEKIPYLLEGVDIVAISDYGKGFLSKSLLKYIINCSREKNIPVVVDPKGEDFSRYDGATVLKPNLGEAYSAAKLAVEAPIELVAQKILQDVDVDQLLITRSEAGISVFNQEGEHFNFPVRLKEVKDVTGAGDTVLSMISVALANGLDIGCAAQLANVAAGIAIEKIGCARINLGQLAERLLEFNVDNKVFDEKHLFALQQALKEKRYIVLGINSIDGMTTPIFRTLKKLSSKDKDQKLVVYIKDTEPDEEFVALLSSLTEVDFIVLKCESLRNLCEMIHPAEVYHMENSMLISLEHPKELLSRLA